MKLLVLDMDGVVNSNYYNLKWINQKLLEYQNSNLYNNCDDIKLAVRKAHREEFCHMEELIFPQLAKRITNIVKKTDCKILWSSTWRLLDKYKDINTTREMFNRRGLPGNRLIGYTPNFSRFSDWNTAQHRGEEIRCWLLNNEFGDFNKVAVVDDSYDAGVNLPNNCIFFQTTIKHGITENIKNKIIKYLNEN